jgi:hypothetical protein
MNLIIKGDTSGVVEAIKGALQGLPQVGLGLTTQSSHTGFTESFRLGFMLGFMLPYCFGFNVRLRQPGICVQG